MRRLRPVPPSGRLPSDSASPVAAASWPPPRERSPLPGGKQAPGASRQHVRDVGPRVPPVRPRLGAHEELELGSSPLLLRGVCHAVGIGVGLSLHDEEVEGLVSAIKRFWNSALVAAHATLRRISQ